MTNEEEQEWADAGFYGGEPGDWMAVGFKLEQAYEWFRSFANVAPTLTPARATWWRNEGFEPAEAASWAASGFRPDEASNWERPGLTPEVALTADRHGVSPSSPSAEALAWANPERPADLKAGYIAGCLNSSVDAELPDHPTEKWMTGRKAGVAAVATAARRPAGVIAPGATGQRDLSLAAALARYRVDGPARTLAR